MRRLFSFVSVGLTSSRVVQSHIVPQRFCATVPSEDDVVKAYGVLGVALSSPYADVKKKYLSLAKEHHPDVSTSTSTSGGNVNRMVEINHAYAVVTRFHKAGRTLAAARANTTSGASSRSAGHNGSGGAYRWANAQQQQSAYHPWHEDVDPLLYEMMWEEMRRQNEEEAFAQSMPDPDGFDGPWNQEYPFYAQYQQQQGAPQSRRWKSNNRSGTRTNQKQQPSSQTEKPVKTTTWPEPDLKALVNMYQDGKSFDFIANALGKETAAVVEEFNRWSEDTKTSHQQQYQKKKSHKKFRNRQGAFYDGPYYYTESPDGDVPFEFYEMMMGGPDGMDVEDGAGDPYGYYDDDDAFSGDGPHGGAMPFTGTHYMHGAPQHTHKTHNNARGQKHRYQGSNQQRRNKRKHNSSTQKSTKPYPPRH